MAMERKHDGAGAKLPSLLRHRVFAPSRLGRRSNNGKLVLTEFHKIGIATRHSSFNYRSIASFLKQGDGAMHDGAMAI